MNVETYECQKCKASDFECTDSGHCPRCGSSDLICTGYSVKEE